MLSFMQVPSVSFTSYNAKQMSILTSVGSTTLLVRASVTFYIVRTK